MLIVLTVLKGFFTVALHAAVLAVSSQLGHLYNAALVLSLLKGLLCLIALQKALCCFLLIILHQYFADAYSVEFVVFLLQDLSENGLLFVVFLSNVFYDRVVYRFFFAVHGE